MADGVASVPKQYRTLAGATVLEHALAPFLADTRCRGAVVAIAAGDARWQDLAVAQDPRVTTVTGGRERRDSVAAAVAALHARLGPADPWVLVHDAARPCVSRSEIDALLAALPRAPDGALLALPVDDTLKQANAAGRVSATVPRTGLWRALTPQAFRLQRLAAALAAPGGASDEASAIEAQGGRPQLVVGSPGNIKLTAPADFGLAEQILGGRHP